ncbi:MAG UNVERIFIED_CONTAM: hypothetical protein LVR18_31205 [Planctomycetaceae bacterium]
MIAAVPSALCVVAFFSAGGGKKLLASGFRIPSPAACSTDGCCGCCCRRLANATALASGSSLVLAAAGRTAPGIISQPLECLATSAASRASV